MYDNYERRDGNGAASGAIVPVKRVKLTKKQRNSFAAAADRLHKNDSEYRLASVLYFVLFVMCVVIGAFALREFCFEPTVVDGESMQNTLIDGERVLVEKVSYWFSKPKRGDIVIVHFPNRDACFVKRIIAFGGETISIRNGYVYIDGEPLDESAYAGDWYGRITRLIACEGVREDGSYVVPYGYVFVMGDNRNWSHDSRALDVGPIAEEQILGKARFVLWPFSKARRVDQW